MGVFTRETKDLRVTREHLRRDILEVIARNLLVAAERPVNIMVDNWLDVTRHKVKNDRWCDTDCDSP